MLLLTKILTLLVYPLSLGLWLLGVGVWWQMRGNRAGAGILTFLAFAVIYAASTEYGAEALARPLEGRFAAFAPEELPNADVIVLLGGTNQGETRFGRGHDYGRAVDRVFAAHELYEAGKAPLILVSGGQTDALQVPEARVIAETLMTLGVPESALIIEEAAQTTYENAVNSAPLLIAANHQHILLVTSAVHMRRSLALFRAQGFEVTAAPTDHEIPRFAPFLPGWLPTVERLGRSTRAVHEWVAYSVYKATGKLAPVVPVAEASDQT